MKPANMSAEYQKLLDRANSHLKNLPDRGDNKYAELAVIYADHAGKANSFIDEAVTRKLIIQFANEDYKMLKYTATQDLAMDPRDFDALVRVRVTNDHTVQAEKLARALKAVTFSMDGDDYPDTEQPVRLKVAGD